MRVTNRVAREYMEENTDSKGNQLNSNTNASTRAAIKSLKERVANGNIVILPTDKSSKFSVMSMETYQLMGQSHISKDRIIEEGELSTIQKELNDMSKMLIKVFRVGENHGELNINRIRSAFTTKAGAPAVLWLLRKDHKKLQPGQLMPSRGVVSITNTLLARSSKLVTNVVKHMADMKEGTSEVKSSENLKAAIDECNIKYKEKAALKARVSAMKPTTTVQQEPSQEAAPD